jgi:hypothetical protein
MNSAPHNPAQNQLPPELPEGKFLKAIEECGYPLQGLVANALMASFSVTEEWGYIDRDSGDHRSLDIFAYRKLRPEPGSLLYPAIALLVECKRTNHVHVFFQRVVKRPIPDYLSVTGCPRRSTISWGNSSRDVHASKVLGLTDLPFLVRPDAGPPVVRPLPEGIDKETESSFQGPSHSTAWSCRWSRLMRARVIFTRGGMTGQIGWPPRS